MPDRSSEGQRFPLIAAFGIYTLAFLAVASPWLSGAVQIPYDSVSQFYPQFAFLARSLAAGQSPFWTPNIFAGWPQIADPQALIFSPLHLIVALLDPNPSPRLFDALTFGLLYIGGAGVILLFRDRRWHDAAAVAAALAFSFGGSAASRIQHIGQIQSLVFLPLAIWMLARALKRSSWFAGAAAGLFASFIVLGRDQVALLGTYVLIGYVLWHWLDGAGRGARFVASLKPLLAGAVTGACIVTVPVVLTELLAQSSNRPEMSFAQAVQGSLHPASLLMLLFADVFGASDFNREFWGPPSIPWHDMIGQTGLYDSQNTGQIYTGALVAVSLAGLALARGALWARDIRFFTAAAALTLLYALGKYTPLYYWLYEFMPGVAFFRRPADATFVLCALLAIVSGYLIHRFLAGTLSPLRRWHYAVAALIVILLVATSLVLARWAAMLESAALPLLWGCGILLAAVGILALARRLALRSAAAAAVVLAVFSAADFAWNNAPNESTGLPSSLFGALHSDTDDETIALLKSRLKAAAAPDRRDRVELIGVAYHFPNIGLVHDFDHLYGHNPLRLGHFENATGAPDTVAAVRGPFTPLLPSYRSALEDLFGVRFLALGQPIEKLDPALRPGDFTLVSRTRDAYVYENPRALPRVLLATEWRKENFAKMIGQGSWPDVDPRRTVLLEQAPADAPSGGASGSVRIVRYENTSIEIEADAPSGGFVVLNDVWHPWWRASVDDKPADILKANVLFRAVAVPPGQHIVRFTFHPFAGGWAELRNKFGAAPN
jgi:hypothetical protein